MASRKWVVILPVATAAGYAAFHLWGALLAPAATVAGLAWRDRRAHRAAERDERRFAEFIESARKELESPPPAPSDQPQPPPADVPIRAQVTARPLDRAQVAARPLSRAQVAARPLSRAQVAARSIALASRANDVALAVALFTEFVALREEFGLDAVTLNRLGPALLEQGAYADAAWAMQAASLAAGDPPAAARRLAEVAGLAAGAGCNEVAAQLYRELLARYPEAGLAGFARARAEELQSLPPQLPQTRG